MVLFNILAIIGFILMWWLAFKLIVRVYAIYKTTQTFFKATKNAHSHKFNRKYQNDNHNNYNQYNNKTKQTKSDSRMVECAKCNLYVPEDESYFAQGKHYCCKEHSS